MKKWLQVVVLIDLDFDGQMTGGPNEVSVVGHSLSSCTRAITVKSGDLVPELLEGNSAPITAVN